MKKTKKLLALLLPVVILLLQFVPLQTVAAATEDPHYAKIIEKGELTVGLSADYAPYEFHTEIDGKDTIVGFDISIAQKIADDLGVKLHIEELGFDALLGALKTGKIDLIISGMAVTEERLKEVNFSDTYMTVTQRLLVRKDDADKFHTTADFADVAVAVQKQTTQEALAKDELTGSIPTSLQKIPDVIMNLKNKKVDAAILEGPVAEAYIDRNQDLVFSDVEFKDGSKETAVAVPKDAPVLLEKINTSIQTIDEQGLLAEYQKEANALMFQDDQGFFAKYYKFYVNGAGYTIMLAFIGVLFGTILGTVLALMKLAKSTKQLLSTSVMRRSILHQVNHCRVTLLVQFVSLLVVAGFQHNTLA